MISASEYFVAWLTGFAAGVQGRPTEEQWQHVMRTLKNTSTRVLEPPPTPMQQGIGKLEPYGTVQQTLNEEARQQLFRALGR